MDYHLWSMDYLIKQSKLNGLLNGFKLVKHLGVVAGVDISNYIAYLRVGYQELAYDIDVVAGKYFVYFSQYTRHVFVNVDKPVRIINSRRL
jgi:hypothetical protein